MNIDKYDIDHDDDIIDVRLENVDNWDTEVTCHLQEEVCTCSPERRNLFVVGGGFEFGTFSLKKYFQLLNSRSTLCLLEADYQFTLMGLYK